MGYINDLISEVTNTETIFDIIWQRNHIIISNIGKRGKHDAPYSILYGLHHVKLNLWITKSNIQFKSYSIFWTIKHIKSNISRAVKKLWESEQKFFKVVHSFCRSFYLNPPQKEGAGNPFHSFIFGRNPFSYSFNLDPPPKRDRIPLIPKESSRSFFIPLFPAIAKWLFPAVKWLVPPEMSSQCIYDAYLSTLFHRKKRRWPWWSRSPDSMAWHGYVILATPSLQPLHDGLVERAVEGFYWIM